MSTGAMKTLFNYFVGPASKNKDKNPKFPESHSEEYVIEEVVDIEVEVVAAAVAEQDVPARNGFRYAVASAASNDPNEDRTDVYMTPDMSVFAVYDGHGGNLACDIATATLAENLSAKVSALGGRDSEIPSVSIEAAIKKAYQECDDLILKEAQEIINCNLIAAAADSNQTSNGRRTHDQKSTSDNSKSSGRCWNGKEFFAVTGKKPERAGSCAVIALFRGKELSLSHVGDCRAFRLCRSEEEIPTAASTDSLYSTCAACVLRRSPRRRKRACSALKSLNVSKSTENYGVTDAGYIAESLTADHCCEEPSERERILACSSDPIPFRPSRGDIEALGLSSAPMRVAGSLSVTRALGDGYLKKRELSVLPYMNHVPYITCAPAVKHVTIGERDIGLILASDGYWNNVSVAETVLTVEEEIVQHSINSSSAAVSATLSGFKRKRTHSCMDLELSCSTDELVSLNEVDVGKPTEQRIADALLKKCIANAAVGSGISAKSLRKMVPGQRRRDIIDDVTIMVILFDPCVVGGSVGDS